MSTTFNAIYLGQHSLIDPTEGNYNAENAGALVGMTFGGENDALVNDFVEIAPAGFTGDYYNQDNWEATEPFTVDGTNQANFDAIVAYNATITYVDGTTADMVVAVFQDDAGNTYMAPFAAAGASQDQLEVKPIRSLTLNSVNKSDYNGMTADRQTWNYAVCFTTGTLIDTADGPRPIETLKAGDLIWTKDHGLQPLRWIGSKEVEATGAFAPVYFAKGALGNERPILLSQQHRVLLSGWQTELVCGEAEALCAAKNLVNENDVYLRSGGRVTYVHLLFDQHEIVFSEGLQSESFHPGDKAMSMLSPVSRQEVLALFPLLMVHGSRGYGSVARPVLRAHEAKLILSMQSSLSDAKSPAFA